MKIDDAIIHRLLDGELSPEERDEIVREVRGDPGLSAAYGGLLATASLLEKEGPCEAPQGFTASIMRQIPVQAPSIGDRLRRFLFEWRELRWNMATALAGAMFIVAALLTVQYRSAGPAAPPAAEHTVTVRLTFYAPQAHEVSVAGDFNRWAVDADRMERRNGGLWTIDLTLQPGRYSYMFVLDGRSWVPDPGAESYQDDGFGGRNAVMRVRT